MHFAVTCQCGKTHPVTAAQAGSTLLCDCSRPIDVPLLSALRRAAGQTAIPLSTLETIEAMIDRGELPSGDLCPHSGRHADRTIFFHVQCERAWVRGDTDAQSGKAMLYVLLFGWFVAIVASLIESKRVRQRQELGRETSIELPLRISSEAASTIAKIKKQAALKSLLKSTPIYAQLLDEFPEAFVSVKEMI